MIKNERQYRITKAQADKFAHALVQLANRPQASRPVHPLLAKAESDALRSQLEDLQGELDEYESLKGGKHEVLELNSFDEVPAALIKARIASNMSQKELADRLGLKEQQVQRYEATEYASASLTRVLETVRALGLHVREDVFLPAADVSAEALFRRMDEFGLDRTFVAKRLLPRSVLGQFEAHHGQDQDSATAALRAASVIGHVFGWGAPAIFGAKALEYRESAIGAARFKLGAEPNERRTAAYTVYAHFLALSLIEATPNLQTTPIPDNADTLRRAILSSQGSLTFEAALRYAWSLGVAVLPLQDSGAFHGACWRVGGRNVIVLKQRTLSGARWLFDLLHELWHLAQEPEQDSLSVIEESETAPERQQSQDEQAASRFAGDIVLGGQAERLAELCVDAAQGRLESLKRVVPKIATEQNVPIDSLANYLAFRLSLQGENWWGAAANLQSKDVNPWTIARNALLERMSMTNLNETDRGLFLRALED